MRKRSNSVVKHMRNWKKEFSTNAARVRAAHDEVVNTLVRIQRSKGADDTVPAKSWEELERVREQWEAAVEELKRLMDEYRHS